MVIQVISTCPLIVVNANLIPDQLVREIYTGLLVDQSVPKQFSLLLDNLRSTEQIAIVEAVFRDIGKKYFSEEVTGFMGSYKNSSEKVNGIATLCSMLIGGRPHLETQVADWLATGQGGSIQSIGLRRAILANFANSKGTSQDISISNLTNIYIDAMGSLLTKSLEHLGDKFYIKHAPMRSQDGSSTIPFNK